MEYSEFTQRTVAALTQAGELKRLLIEDPDRDDDELNDSAELLVDLVGEVLRADFTVPGDATVDEIVKAASEAIAPQVFRLLASFAWAYRDLADAHDAGDPAESSAEILRRWALRAQQD